jgi:hypothetical protein
MPALAGFTVAVSDRSKHNGEWQDDDDGFFRCTAWRSVAENAAHTLKEGDTDLRCRQARQRIGELRVAVRRRQLARRPNICPRSASPSTLKALLDIRLRQSAREQMRSCVEVEGKDRVGFFRRTVV